MRIRRYYKKGVNYNYTISEEFLKKMTTDLGKEKTNKLDNASYELILDNEEEERAWFYDCCNRVINNPRWYLDNLDYLPTFRVKYKQLFPEKRF
jgi:hypothetical protein